MSERWPGGIVSSTPVTPTGPVATGRAPGVWTLDQAAYWQKQGLWPDASLQPDIYFPYVSLLLSTTSLGNANNNLFVDSSGAFNPVSRFGNTTQGSFTPYATNWSNYFDGNGDYLQIPNNAALGVPTGDFTFETWVYPTALTGQNYTPIAVYAINNVSVASDLGYACIIKSNNTIEFAVYVGSTAYRATSTSTISANTWTHVAGVRSGNTLTLYLNGASAATVTISGTINDSTNPVYRIGGYQETSTFYYFTGYISNQRFVKGTAVYTANFTPSGTPLTAISGTSLLTCQSNRFRDASTNNFTITVAGNTSVTDFSPFSPGYPGITYNQSDITNWSGYFDGSGDYLTTPSNAAFAYGTGDFTLECWINVAAPSNSPIMESRSTDSATDGFTLTALNSTTIRIYTNSAILTGTVPNYAAQWTHVAVVKASGTTTLYVNGISYGTTASLGNMTNTDVVIGGGKYGGSSSITNSFPGYISNFRIVKGTAVYTGAFTPPTSPLTAISGTSLLTCQNAAFTDNSTNNFVITPFGNTTVTGNSPFNTVGYWSNYFDGSGDYFTVPYTTANFDWWTSGVDFTIEYWFFANSSTGISYSDAGLNHSTVIGNRSATTTTDYWSFGPTSAGTVTFYYFNGGANAVTSTATYSLNTWNHVAMTKTSSGITVFVNGVAGTTTAISGTPQSSTGVPLTVGQGNNSSFNGYVSNLRIVRGTAIYSGSFTVPTTPLTAVTNTKLLTCQNGRFIDNSTNALTITPAGNVAAQSFDPFYTATIASNGGSIFADGTGDYLTIPSSPTIAPLSSAFTWECWFYPNSFVGNTGDGDTLWITSGSGGLQIGCDANTANWGVARNGIAWVLQTSTFPTNKMWNHIAIVRSGTGTNQAAIFLNGTRVVQGTLSSSFPAGSTNVLSANGGAGNSIDGYVSNMRLVVGTAIYNPSVSTCTVPTAPANPTPATGLLLNGMNAGIYDATTINDMETVGNAQVSTVQSKFGGSSVYFDGSGDYLETKDSPQFAFGTGDFTIEGWFYTNTTSGDRNLVDFRPTSTNGAYPNVFIAAGGYLSYNANGIVPITGSTVIATGTWYHFALARSGTSTKLFLNGVQQGSTYTDTTNYLVGTNRPRIAVAGYGTSVANFNGYLDDIRITKGVARYTSNFTPPTQAFPTY